MLVGPVRWWLLFLLDGQISLSLLVCFLCPPFPLHRTQSPKIPEHKSNTTLPTATATYLVDTYQAANAASALSANGILRYTLGAVFPLFTLPMYRNLGIGWATSLLGFIAAALIPVPWVLFKWGHVIRAKSHYDTLEI